MENVIQSIELKLGQVWEDGQGGFVLITGVTGDPRFPFSDRYGNSYRADGRFTGNCKTIYDLVRLVGVGPAQTQDEPGPVGDTITPTTFSPLSANDAGVGDINSDAKGSGARFNTGKVPYELVPLELMAIHYEQLILLDLPIDATPCTPHEAASALSCLGAFQARRDNDALVDVLIELGDGWEDCAHVFDYGQKKYTAWNWSRGMAWSVPMACAARHLQAMIRGEVNDPESGKPHRGHVYANVCMLFTFQETFAEGDDRPAEGMLADNETYL